MADDLSYTGPRDRTRINVNESWEIRWWTKHLGCTEAKLREAVKAVGVMVIDVRKYLSTH